MRDVEQKRDKPEVERQMKRNRVDIIVDILQAAKDGAKKTHVMYQCNLSFRQTNEFLADLLEAGLLRMGDSYHTTEKGMQFLQAYQTLRLLLNTKN